MQLAFAADPLASFKISKDSTYAMMVEADRRGHELWSFEPASLEKAASGQVQAHVARLRLTGDPHSWYVLEPRVWRPLSEFGAVVMRKDPPFDLEYLYATLLLGLAEAQGAFVTNKPQAIRDHNEKLAIAGFSEFTAPTLVTRDAQRLRAFHAEHADIILKPLDGMGGMGVFRVGPDELNLGAIIESVSCLGSRTVMAQRYIPEIRDGDKRILLIGGVPVPYCLARVPQGREIRGNLAQGGVGRAQPLSARDTQIATTLGPILHRRGLLLVGIDVIGDYLTEINVTSPTCFQEITEQSGFPVAATFISALEAAVSAAHS